MPCSTRMARQTRVRGGQDVEAGQEDPVLASSEQSGGDGDLVVLAPGADRAEGLGDFLTTDLGLS